MKKNTRWVGLDVHAETIAIAVADADGTATSVGTVPNDGEALCRAMKKLGAAGQLRVCYEAGPCGYVVYWQLVRMGVECSVVAPTLVPVRSGDRVKTDQRDALKLARCHRSGELTAVWVPDAEHEALRDLVRAREAASKDLLRSRHRLSKFLLRRGVRRPKGVAWGTVHMDWLGGLRFERFAHEATFVDYLAEVRHALDRIERLDKAIDTAMEQAPLAVKNVVAALQALRGVAKTTAVTVVTEVGSFSRFSRATEMMAYVGVVPSEHSSGKKTRRGAITKTGNAHVRRVLGEAAWSYRFRPNMFKNLRKRSAELPQTIQSIAWKAQHRLHTKYLRMTLRGKPHPQVITAMARELVGFMWAIGVESEKALKLAA